MLSLFLLLPPPPKAVTVQVYVNASYKEQKALHCFILIFLFTHPNDDVSQALMNVQLAYHLVCCNVQVGQLIISCHVHQERFKILQSSVHHAAQTTQCASICKTMM